MIIIVCKSHLVIDVNNYKIDTIEDIIGRCVGAKCNVTREKDFIRVYGDLYNLYNCLFALSCGYKIVLS